MATSSHENVAPTRVKVSLTFAVRLLVRVVPAVVLLVAGPRHGDAAAVAALKLLNGAWGGAS